MVKKHLNFCKTLPIYLKNFTKGDKMAKFKLRYIILLSVLLALFFAVPIPFISQQVSGARVIEISSAEDLVKMGEIIETAEECDFKLTCDIDMQGYIWQGTGIKAFSGEFDGSGFTIKNLTINSSFDDNCVVGFWSYTKNAYIHDVNFENISADVSSCGKTTFGIIGYAENGAVQNVRVSSSDFRIEGLDVSAGGLIGCDNGEGLRSDITFSGNSFNVSSRREANFGGLAGYVKSDALEYKICTSQDEITLTQEGKQKAFVGGILGVVEGETIKLRELTSSSQIEVNAKQAQIGDFIGQIDDTTVLNITLKCKFDGKIIHNII